MRSEERVSYLTGLLGYPLGHSVSPAMHNAAFEALGLDGRYDALPTPPERLAETVAGLAAAGYRGVNVTIPHKQAVMPLLDELSDAAQAIGAVNTVVVEPVNADPVNGIHRLKTQRPLRAWENVSPAPEGALQVQPADPVNGIHRLKTQRPLRAWENVSPAPEGASHVQPADPVNGIHRLTTQRPLRAWENVSPAPEGALQAQPGISIPGLRGDNTDWLGFLHPLDAAGFELGRQVRAAAGRGRLGPRRRLRPHPARHRPPHHLGPQPRPRRRPGSTRSVSGSPINR